MKRLLLSLGLFSASCIVHADWIFAPAGQNLTFGSVSNYQYPLAYTNNPATGAASLGMEDWNFGIGVISNVTVGAEIGPVDNLTERWDALSVELDKFENRDPTIQEVNDIKAQFDDFLINAGDNGSAQINVAAHVPLFPLIWSSRETLGGSLVFDANTAAQAKLRILDRPIEYNPLAQGTNQIQTNSAAYIKVAAVAEASLGYSRPVFELDQGTLIAGVKAKYYQVGLKKTLLGAASGGDIEGVLEDEMDDEPDQQSAFGLDLGVLWVSKNYRVGATFRNVNSPSFEYGDIGTDCENKSGAAQDSCYIAKSFANELDTSETYTMDAQINVEAAFYNDSRNWLVAVSADTSPVNDPVANEIQWFTVGAGYATRSWIIPGIRVGYRKNLAGSQLSAVTAGLTLFRSLHLDAAYGLETVKVDGDEAPRMLQVNLGLDFLF